MFGNMKYLWKWKKKTLCKTDFNLVAVDGIITRYQSAKNEEVVDGRFSWQISLEVAVAFAVETPVF